jgi:hypothetical protein
MTTHFPSLAGFALIVALAAPAAAQTAAAPAPDPNPGNMTLTGSFDVVSTYMFRGIRQNGTGIAMWPAVDLGIAAYSGMGGLKSVGINVGTWNSLHTGDTGADSQASLLGCAESCGTNPTSTRRSGWALAAGRRSARSTRRTRAPTTGSPR